MALIIDINLDSQQAKEMMMEDSSFAGPPGLNTVYRNWKPETVSPGFLLMMSVVVWTDCEYRDLSLQ